VARHLDVVGAVIVHDSRVLCAQRGPHGDLAGLWEFPGGKVEPDEDPRDALEREIREELRCAVEVGDEVTTTSHEYDFGVVALTTFFCRLGGGTPDPLEHASIRWMAPAELGTLTWAPVDIPAIAVIRAHLAAPDQVG
jgi:8-oxo-dGTP diphosphatase